MRRILVITNDFPPRNGGIETFAYEIVRRFPSDKVVVLAARRQGDQAWDAKQDFPIVRSKARILLPTWRTKKLAEELIAEYDCDGIWFISSVPLGLLAKKLQHNPRIKKIVASTHGHETWWVRLPLTRQLLQRVAKHVGVMTFISEHTRKMIAPSLAGKTSFQLLRPAVDKKKFFPRPAATQLAQQYDLVGKRVILCVGRLVKRKGQDLLIKALPQVLAVYPEAVLVIVGSGPQYKHLRRLVNRYQLGAAVRLVTDFSYEADLADMYALCEVFCMPCHTIRAGLEEEGLGIVYLEAAAMEKPVIAGTSGGAPETVVPNVTGLVTEANPPAVAASLQEVLAHPQRSIAWGKAGRKRILAGWTWEDTYRNLLQYFS